MCGETKATQKLSKCELSWDYVKKKKNYIYMLHVNMFCLYVILWCFFNIQCPDMNEERCVKKEFGEDFCVTRELRKVWLTASCDVTWVGVCWGWRRQVWNWGKKKKKNIVDVWSNNEFICWNWVPSRKNTRVDVMWCWNMAEEKKHLLCLSSGSASFEGIGLCGFRRQVLWRDLVNRVSRC